MFRVIIRLRVLQEPQVFPGCSRGPQTKVGLRLGLVSGMAGVYSLFTVTAEPDEPWIS